jgi:hypothetical protein
MKKRPPDIQKQLRYHYLACLAGLRFIEAQQARNRKEAVAARIEGRKWERLYREYGGKRPILFDPVALKKMRVR